MIKMSHTHDTPCDTSLEIIKDRKLDKLVYIITIDIVTNSAKSLELLQKALHASTCLAQYKPRGSFHVHCIAHMLNLTVKECMYLIDNKLHKFIKLSTSSRRFMNNRISSITSTSRWALHVSSPGWPLSRGSRQLLK